MVGIVYWGELDALRPIHPNTQPLETTTKRRVFPVKYYNPLVQPINLPNLTLDGTQSPLEYTAAEIETFYIPLAQYLLHQSIQKTRYVVGIAGPPACGKSAFCSLLSAVINALAGDRVSAAIGLDGWHFPNWYLDSHFIHRGGVELPLRKVKGSPPSFDAQSALAFLHSLRISDSLTYPTYSRILHDPIPDSGRIETGQRIILIEGNYLLLDQPPWDQFKAQFDLSIFLTAPREPLIQSLRERHLRGGKDPQAVENHMRFSDIPNFDLILSHSVAADLVIEKKDSRAIRQIIYPESGR